MDQTDKAKNQIEIAENRLWTAKVVQKTKAKFSNWNQRTDQTFKKIYSEGEIKKVKTRQFGEKNRKTLAWKK